MTDAVFTPQHTAVRKAVIPAAGLGTRLRPLTDLLPKELLPVGRAPVLAQVTTELRAAGITRALFVVSERKPQIRAFFGDLYTGGRDDLPPLQCEYVLQQEPAGSGHAVLCAEAWVGAEPFVVAFGDCLIESAREGEPLQRLLVTHLSHRSAGTVLVEEVPREKVSRYGVVAPRTHLPETVTAPFALRDIVEKPAPEAAPSHWVIAARWVLEPALFEALKRDVRDARGECNIPDALRTLGTAERSLWAVPLRADLNEARRDIGSMESYLTEFTRAALRDPDDGKGAREVATRYAAEFSKRGGGER